MTKKFHPFHLVDSSPWPLFSSLALFSLAVLSYYSMSFGSLGGVMIGMVGMFFCSTMWWRDVIRESTFQGNHTKEVCEGIYLGVILFIISEVMFFFSFFFSYFFSSLNPDVVLGNVWPPVGVESLDFQSTPLLNTLILLSSGVSVTWAHHSILSNKKKEGMVGLFVTVMLGVIFSSFQVFEYMEMPFTIADSVFGSLFFIMTGFHGIHVLVGTLFLFVGLLRLVNGHFSKTHHLGFEAAAWYWHFVDVVWLGLFLLVYWWGG